MHNSIKESHSGKIDFDDQIYMSVLFGGSFKRFETVIVDESQDLSPLQHLMLTKLVGTRLIMIGDPYQAIYGFRGADSNSMTNLAEMFGYSKAAPLEPMTVLPMTYSFRCPHGVASRQLDHVPDFKSHEVCLPGKVESWPLLRQGEQGCAATWSISAIPASGAILCRNNAPLMQLAFQLIAARRPVTILGRDIGKSLANLLKKICNKQLSTSVQTGILLVESWAKVEIEKLGNKESKKEAIYDRRDCLMVLLEASGAENISDAVTFIQDLFTDRPDKLVLSSGHRSKGLEWDWVMHLDPWRLPSRFAESQARQGNDAPMLQELNLRYVIETRTKDVLVLATLGDCDELQGARNVQQKGGLR
jgi:superfamily I DNA/RNA helicase